MDFRGVSGMGKTIEEKMREYNEVKDALQNLSKNKEKNKRETNAQLAMTPWGTVILIAFICILAGSLAFYFGINNIKSIHKRQMIILKRFVRQKNISMN